MGFSLPLVCSLNWTAKVGLKITIVYFPLYIYHYLQLHAYPRWVSVWRGRNANLESDTPIEELSCLLVFCRIRVLLVLHANWAKASILNLCHKLRFTLRHVLKNSNYSLRSCINRVDILPWHLPTCKRVYFNSTLVCSWLVGMEKIDCLAKFAGIVEYTTILILQLEIESLTNINVLFL